MLDEGKLRCYKKADGVIRAIWGKWGYDVQCRYGSYEV